MEIDQDNLRTKLYADAVARLMSISSDFLLSLSICKQAWFLRLTARSAWRVLAIVILSVCLYGYNNNVCRACLCRCVVPKIIQTFSEQTLQWLVRTGGYERFYILPRIVATHFAIYSI